MGYTSEENRAPNVNHQITVEINRRRSERYAWAMQVDPAAVIDYELRAKLYRVPAVVLAAR